MHFELLNAVFVHRPRHKIQLLLQNHSNYPPQEHANLLHCDLWVHGHRKLMCNEIHCTHVLRSIEASAAGWAHGEGADRKWLRELLHLERELVTGTINLSQPKPPKLDLHTHAVHLMYRSRFDDASNCGGETKLELLATEGDGGSRTP